MIELRENGCSLELAYLQKPQFLSPIFLSFPSEPALSPSAQWYDGRRTKPKEDANIALASSMNVLRWMPGSLLTYLRKMRLARFSPF
ncbi:MAG: hypothetical protein ACI8T1_001702 [Verrucomicrobiales bacterium]|jgi:hypothetical protein